MHDVSNEFVHHLAETANDITIKKGKSKIVPEDIFQAAQEYNFSENDLKDIKEKLEYFEKHEVKRSKKK